jgi:uncharacterized protein YecE (DUF72 family)
MAGGGVASGAMIRVGIGGWTYEPWRGVFYPPDLPQARELSYASRRLGTIEINGTFYRTQKPESFRRWAAESPDRFVYSLKAPRYATNRPRLAEAGPSIERFFASGVTELGDKFGPVLWQLPPNKRFDADDLAAFLGLLPRTVDGRSVRHALEVRHESFRSPQLVDLLRSHRVALVFTDSPKFPSIPDLTADFVYARLQRAEEMEPDGYPPAELDRWAARLRCWASGSEPDDLPQLLPATALSADHRDCFVYMIDGAKVRAPAAAMALIERVALTRASLRAPPPPERGLG